MHQVRILYLDVAEIDSGQKGCVMTVMITGGEDLDHEEARDTRDTGPGGEDSPKSPLIP